ncbi:MAG TPA: lysophospholipid acyltransferase family protein [Polyangiaceae bacterium LLY-WYZ-15_(1-7)]|nr:glycerol acyltransferase [Sandaracinus sp.]HJK90871.1 lysophospholipid acyltransferase family protein [Polyangiaceae bacterium LLY-WYZ-15_(1-7)]MBJ74914.1 glycerol acyltransferase [Sandaracinus sp.]HJK99946.1 lysophospholipid acyltransferase family protein [Polyangiaceae bacterium LLY-WYZ-15_(1-7)]HJL11472.1 lysophospholipid acyltransferase family protein [Polyangiaceae bacterium LLY-WYZ-15_(1-7)]
MRHPFEHPLVRGLVGGLGAALDALVDDEIEDLVRRLPMHTNPWGYDGWGTSKAAARRSLALVRFFYRRYFRVETEGIEHIPEGRVLLIGNHSGQLPIDGVLVAAALVLDREPPRHVHAMIERFFAGVPFVNVFMMRMGQQIGLPQHCERLLERDDAAVLVFPEGVKGSGKVVWKRYRLMGFGQGFMRLAMRTNTPIVPFGFVGGEEMAFSFSRMRPLAKLFGLPYLPLSPTVALPLPVRCHLTFGAPLHFEGTGNEEDEAILENVARVEDAVSELIARGRQRRGRRLL